MKDFVPDAECEKTYDHATYPRDAFTFTAEARVDEVAMKQITGPTTSTTTKGNTMGRRNTLTVLSGNSVYVSRKVTTQIIDDGAGNMAIFFIGAQGRVAACTSFLQDEGQQLLAAAQKARARHATNIVIIFAPDVDTGRQAMRMLRTELPGAKTRGLWVFIQTWPSPRRGNHHLHPALQCQKGRRRVKSMNLTAAAIRHRFTFCESQELSGSSGED